MISFVCNTKVNKNYPNMEVKVAKYCQEVKRWSFQNLGQGKISRQHQEGEEEQGKQDQGTREPSKDKVMENQESPIVCEERQRNERRIDVVPQGWQPHEMHKLLQKSAKAKAQGHEKDETRQGSQEKRRRSRTTESQRSRRRLRHRSSSSEKEERKDMPDCFFFTPEGQRAEVFNYFPDYAAAPCDPFGSPTTTVDYEDYQEEGDKTKEDTGLEGGKEVCRINKAGSRQQRATLEK